MQEKVIEWLGKSRRQLVDEMAKANDFNIKDRTYIHEPSFV